MTETNNALGYIIVFIIYLYLTIFSIIILPIYFYTFKKYTYKYVFNYFVILNLILLKLCERSIQDPSIIFKVFST